ncbi:dihydrodipicolinate synthase family protein [Exiguobacterium artemiae]|uniref:dihydrodipicolinate synthase family protein n=1 Tax=Exiguobacterium artemiae TaxID=340145 RepID=UPI000555C143|nr:dihydrodipicolinate synthase family protein [Exiguobacterium sibiricum]
MSTAFFRDEALNVNGTIEHIRYLFDQGEKSILVCGSTGEQHSLELKEKLFLLEALMIAHEHMIEHNKIGKS